MTPNPYRELAVVAGSDIVLRHAPGLRVVCTTGVYKRCIAMHPAAAIANGTVDSRTRDVLEGLEGAYAAKGWTFKFASCPRRHGSTWSTS